MKIAAVVFWNVLSRHKRLASRSDDKRIKAEPDFNVADRVVRVPPAYKFLADTA